MSEHQFITECERLLDTIEEALDASELDIDLQRTGHVLEIEFANKTRIVINGQVPMQEIWLAAPSGAHHFRKSASNWIDTRSGDELSAVLSRCASRQSGEEVIVAITDD